MHNYFDRPIDITAEKKYMSYLPLLVTTENVATSQADPHGNRLRETLKETISFYTTRTSKNEEQY